MEEFKITEDGWYVTRDGAVVYLAILDESDDYPYDTYPYGVYVFDKPNPDVVPDLARGWDYTVTEYGLVFDDCDDDPDNIHAEYPRPWPVLPLQKETKTKTTAKPSNPKDSIGIRKVPMSVVPANVLAEIGVALAEGALKYARHNYRKVGVRGSVYYDATMRHLMSWWEGESIDEDSGMSHVTKAITSLIVLRDSMMQENWVDDRPPKSKPFYPELNQKMSALLDKYKDTDVEHITELNVRTCRVF